MSKSKISTRPKFHPEKLYTYWPRNAGQSQFVRPYQQTCYLRMLYMSLVCGSWFIISHLSVHLAAVRNHIQLILMC